MDLIYRISPTVLGEVFHPRSKLAGYSTEKKRKLNDKKGTEIIKKEMK